MARQLFRAALAAALGLCLMGAYSCGDLLKYIIPQGGTPADDGNSGEQ
jgi:hypothetical protein